MLVKDNRYYAANCRQLTSHEHWGLVTLPFNTDDMYVVAYLQHSCGDPWLVRVSRQDAEHVGAYCCLLMNTHQCQCGLLLVGRYRDAPPA
jgi:hypothetical protein